MKKLLIIVSILITSCTSRESEVHKDVNEQQNEVYTELPPPPSAFAVDYADKECLAEFGRAKADIEKGLLVYSKYGTTHYRNEDEFEELLNNYKIEYKPIGENCLAELNCYGHYMDSVITQKYGIGFIDSLRIVADKLFTSKWATKTYKYWNLEVHPQYGDTSPEEYILSKLKFPRGWDEEPMRSERQYIDAEFIVDTAGAVSNIKIGDFSYNLKSTNQKHLEYLKQEIKKIIEGMGTWQPAELNSHKVKSWYLVDINLDRNNLPQQKL